MRQAHGIDEVGLELRLHGRFDLLDPADYRLDLVARALVQERDARARPRRVACGIHLFQRAIRDHTQHHRILGVDMTAEGTRQADLVDLLDAELVHQEPDARIKRRFSQLDGADVVLDDPQFRQALATSVDQVGEGPAVFLNARADRCH